MFVKIVVTILISVPVTLSARIVVPEEGKLDFTGLAVKYGGVVQEYDVTTEDGYILKVFRITGNKTSPVLLVHGLFATSDDFILRGNDSLAVALINAGYDVWLSNFRGNRYSRRHVTINPDTDSTFWQFGPHEHGYYDLAATIDLVLNKTGERNLSLIGHSEGTMVVYILGAERPEYNDKIKVFIAMAPICHLDKVRTKIPFLEEIGNFVRKVLRHYNINEVFGYDSFSGTMIKAFCVRSSIGAEICRQLLLRSAGYEADGIEVDFMPTLFSHFPAGSSRTNLEHFLQIVTTKRFAKFDYGQMKNLKRYGSKVPPEYDLKKVTVKTYMIAAKNDRLSVLEDSRRQARELPNVKEYKVVEKETFNHVDFLWSVQSAKIVHPRVLEILNTNN